MPMPSSGENEYSALGPRELVSRWRAAGAQGLGAQGLLAGRPSGVQLIAPFTALASEGGGLPMQQSLTHAAVLDPCSVP